MTKLSKFPQGGMRELLFIAIPLLLSGLSVHLMMFLDRLILANYSTEALNAAVAAGMVYAMFQSGAMGIAGIAGVFVGRYNGAGKKSKLGEPVWQMLWFSLFTILMFWPFAQFGAAWLVPDELHTEGIPYFIWVMYFGPLVGAIAALCAFFIGQGKTRLVLVSTIVGNVINLGLDLVFVFGIKGFLDPMGARGAAIATVISQGSQVAILFVIFFNKDNRKTCGTIHFAFKIKSFLQCLSIGTPSALGHMIEIGAVAYVIHLVASVSVLHNTVLSVGISVLIVIAFAINGMHQAIMSIASNFIGAKQPQLVKKMFQSSIKVWSLFTVVLIVPLVFYPTPIIAAFVKEGTTSLNLIEVDYFLRLAFAWLILFFFFDGIRWNFAGVLTAGGDTRFIMIMCAVAAWVFNVLPVYYFVVIGGKSPAWIWGIWTFSAIANAAAFFMRYRTHKWKSKIELESAHELAPMA